MIGRVARISRIQNPLIVLPPQVAIAADALQRLGVPFGTLEGIRLMAPNWRYSAAKARKELGYSPRPAGESLRRTVEWYLELIEDDRLPARRNRSFDWSTRAVRLADRFGLLAPLRVAGGLTGRRTVL